MAFSSASITLTHLVWFISFAGNPPMPAAREDKVPVPEDAINATRLWRFVTAEWPLSSPGTFIRHIMRRWQTKFADEAAAPVPHFFDC